MKKIFFVLLAVLTARAAGAAPKYAGVDGFTAVPLAADNGYFRNPGNPAYDYWALASFYIPQRNGASCSSASAAMAFNALLSARRTRGDEEENITEAALVARVSGIKWKELAGEGGSDGKYGLTLAQLAAGVKEGMASYGAEAAVTSVSVSTPSAAALEAFRAALAANEASPADIMLIHFTQDTVTGAPGGPFAHISPVGAYDAKTRRVLIMDVDRQWYEPYWAADAQVLKAMAAETKSFGHGGYVTIRRVVRTRI